MQYDTTNERGRELFARMIASLQEAGATYEIVWNDGLATIEPAGCSRIARK